MAALVSSSLGARKRHVRDAFASGTDAELTDASRKRRAKADDGHGSYTVDVQRLCVKKKKNTYQDYFSEQPPSGFTYLPVGFRKIKEWCRDECLRTGTLYYVVSLFPDRDARANTATNMITKNIYRHGWHFPQDMILSAFRAHGLNSQRSVSDSRNPILRQATAPPEAITVDNLTDLFKDLFPGMPDNDILMVINHAFKQGSGRVGESEELQYVRRVQLAVLAHIRHTYTDYDSRLKSKLNSRHLARLNIEGQCLSKLLKWRGEDDEFELEERDEEVLIIQDSDTESEDELAEWHRYLNGRGDSQDSDIEVVGVRDLKTSKERFKKDLPSVFYSPKFAGLAPRRSISRLPQTPQFRRASLAEAPHSSQSSNGTPQSARNPSMLKEALRPMHRVHSHADLRDAGPNTRPPGLQASITHHNNAELDPLGYPTSEHRPLLPQSSVEISWPRPVTVLVDSPSGVPRTVVDKHGNIFSFDQFNHTITPISSPRSVKPAAVSANMPPLHQSANHRAASTVPTPANSTYLGSDGQRYRLIPVADHPIRSLETPFTRLVQAADSGRGQGYHLMPAHAHFVDLTLDESPARPPQLRPAW